MSLAAVVADRSRVMGHVLDGREVDDSDAVAIEQVTAFIAASVS